ncbi:microfibrillar-associated protein 1-like isoform X2 [Hylaeus volcanicus]|uniref:microfibrillar-associated protein 1-like isoform X2 n=1 Tax=Hylaeus volcanicus TaxID=313075 RepID=UPI0023B8760D|nr:microfibrillar-associated protein 1-like isoform X2 [Hylaeus volcanicus]
MEVKSKTIDTVITLRVGVPQTSLEANEEQVENSRLRKRAIALEARLKEEAVKRSEFEALQPSNEIQSEENSDTSSEYSSEQDVTHENRPIFLPRNQRTLCQDQKREITQPLDTPNDTNSSETRRKESKDLLVSVIAEEEEQLRRYLEANQKGAWDPESLPDDDDAVNEEAEYELWRIREMKRILRCREEANKRQVFLSEIERRRHMTEEERREDDKRLDALKPQREKPSKYKFMQKYYHKGAFFQDKAETAEEPLYLRDYNVPVGEDNIDKTLLPQPMRLRRDQFGKAGQVKHTHLADVDTTDFTSAWYKANTTKSFPRNSDARKKNKISKYNF